MNAKELLEAMRFVPGGPIASVDADDLISAGDSDRAIAIVRKDYEVVTLKGPEATVRKHTFHDVASFADWLNRHADTATAEILVDERAIVAALAPGTVRGDCVTCSLRRHPIAEKVDGALAGQPMGQRELLLFVRSIRERIEAAEDILMGLRSLKTAHGVELKTEVDHRSGATIFSGVGQQTDISGTIPESITVVAPLWEGVLKTEAGKLAEIEATYAMPLLVTVNNLGPNGLTFSLECPEQRIVESRARRDVRDHLAAALNDGFLVGLGHVKVDVTQRPAHQ